jgi:toxin ParE1/3/4
MKIFYTYESARDLKRLHEFITNHNPKAASEVSGKLLQAIKRLIEFPSLGKEVKPTNGVHSLRDLITGKYIVRYAVLNKEIHIVRVWHGKEEQIFA